MTRNPDSGAQPFPNAVAFSFATLAIPAVATIGVPPEWAETTGPLWLIGLVPTMHLALLQRWRGAAVAMAATMGLLVLVSLAGSALQRYPPASLAWTIPLFLLLGTTIGAITQLRATGGRAWAPRGRSRDSHQSADSAPPGPALDRAFRSARESRPLSAVLFELDGLGERPSDEASARIATATATLREIVGATATPSLPEERPGSVLALLDGADEEAAALFAERVRAAFASALPEAGPPIEVSAGVASRRPAMGSPDDLLAATRLALRRAREGGDGSVRIFGRPASASAAVSAAQAGHRTRDLTQAGAIAGASADRAAEGRAGSLEAPVHLRGAGRRVLLVDDDTPVRTLVSTHLQKLGFSVLEASDPLEGTRALAEEFDAVITDLPSPDRPEASLVSAVKARWPSTPVVAVTGFGDARLAAEALHAGADRYLFKPFGMAELESHVAELLAKRDAFFEEKRHAVEGSPDERAGSEDAILDGLRALARGVEVRDPFTKGHAARVGAYTMVLLEAFESESRPTGIDPSRLRLACELLDVGKLGVPERVLNKDDRLTDEEYRQVRAHPRIGHRIIAPLLEDELILAVCAWHHERWDGKGYPDRLAGEAIPFPARLVALSDSLDAMTSPRAYRPGLEWDDAIGQIRARSGSQFDPGLLTAFERALPRLAKLFEEARFPPPPAAPDDSAVNAERYGAEPTPTPST